MSDAGAIFIGWQSGGGIVPDFPLFNLLRAAGDLPAHTTVSAATLYHLGIEVPEVPAQSQAIQPAGGAR